MNYVLWPIRVALITMSFGCLALVSAPGTCQAQFVHSSSSFHLDDRGTIQNQPAGLNANGQVASAARAETNQFVPPPLLEPATNSSVAPQPLASDTRVTPPNVPQPAKPTPRKNYLPEQKPISQISIDVTSKAKAGSSLRPETLAGTPTAELPAVMGATAEQMELAWGYSPARPSELFPYKPLYFEEANLERYGRSAGIWQPAISTTRFFATVPLLPYKVAAHSPHRPYYWAWPYAAGTSAPYVSETLPFQPRAALVEGATLTGLAFLIP